MELRPASIEFAPEIFAFLKRNPSENGFENGFEDWNYESFFAYGLPSMIACANGEGLKPGYVAQTHCFLFEDREVVGYFKVRHKLTRALRNYAGHIGFCVDKAHRGKGYGKAGLKLALEFLRNLPDFEDEFILTDCNKDNLPSFYTQLGAGGTLYRVEDGICHFLYPGKDELFIEPPITQYCASSDSYINPKKEKLLPSKMIICFFHEIIEKLKETSQIEEILVLKGENKVPIYSIKGTDVCLMPGLIGAASTGGFAEEAIGSGVNKILFLGGCGVLTDIPVGRLLVVKEALRQDGFSYSYLPPNIRAKTNRAVMRHIEETIQGSGLEFQEVTTWTTDAFYRESKEKVAAMKELGAETVEMEQAGLIALSIYRGIDYGALLYAGDDLSTDQYDQRAWASRTDIRSGLLNLALKIFEDWQ